MYSLIKHKDYIAILLLILISGTLCKNQNNLESISTGDIKPGKSFIPFDNLNHFESGDSFAAEIRKLKPRPKKRVEKRSISDNIDDLHCLENFETSERTIIRTKESQEKGAVFINLTSVETYERCFSGCCQTGPI